MPADRRLIDQAEADRLVQERVNPAAEDLARIPELQGAHFVNLTLCVSSMVMRVNFSGSVLERVNFDDSNLDGAAFDQSRLKDCDLTRINAARVWAEKAVFEQCRFANSYLRGAHFKQAHLERCDFTQ